MISRNYHPVRVVTFCCAIALSAVLTMAQSDPGSSTDPSTWKPVPYAANAPIGGVTLDGGLFQTAFDNNVKYLTDSFSTNDLLWDFRKRMSDVDPPHDRPPVGFWVTDLLGSNAGRFMMGAGNAVRWTNDPALHKKVQDVLDGIAACKEPDGYCLAYKPEGFLHSEQANYARAWFTQGLVACGIAGYPEAYRLLRGQMDWFDHCQYLPKLIHLSLGLQGHIASTRAYFTPVGKAEDLQVAEKYYVQKWWMDGLTAHDPMAICKYRLDRPHCYEVVGFEAYLDHYRATGQKKYLDAMNGAWDLMHDDFEHVGGEMAICEGGYYPPKSWFISPAHHTGELCGSVFWVNFNQRFHLLYPDQEKYVTEIEKSIYNVGLANQDGSHGIRYHAFLRGHKAPGTRENTCCEGQGTRLFGSLPEYIYSVASDGLYVDLFEPSTITFKQGDDSMTVRQVTDFPFKPQDLLQISTARPVKSILRVRIPSWASGPMEIQVNGKVVATGKPGSYEPLERTWNNGDSISFTLPMDLHLTHYEGYERDPNHERYFIEYGPILMAVVGPVDGTQSVRLIEQPEDIKNWARPRPDRAINFNIAGDSDHTIMPYFQVTNESFDCVPVLDPIAISGAPKFVTTNRIEMTPANKDGEILYTIDGTNPGAGSARYSGPVTIDHTATIKARLALTQSPSPVVSETFRKIPLYAPSLSFTADMKRILLRMPFEAPGVTLHYTLDGSDPTESSPAYAAPFPAPSAGTLIRARAFAPGSSAGGMADLVVPADPAASPWQVPDVSLSDLKAVSATVGWKTVQINHNILGNQMKLGGRAFAKGIGVHARSELVYDLKPNFTRFIAVAGIDDATVAKGSVTFEVHFDDELAYETPLVRGNNDLWHIDVPVPAGARQIRLVLTDGGDDYNYDWGDWADAGFVVRK